MSPSGTRKRDGRLGVGAMVRSTLSPMRPAGLLSVLACVLVSSCGAGPSPVDANTDANIDTSHEAVLSIVRTSCVFSSCHGGPRSGASRLNFQPVVDGTMTLRDVLVDRPSCEYDPMPLVTPGDPDRSWLMLKLDGPHTPDRAITFTPDESWDPGIERRPDGTYPASICPLVSRGEITFGALMPQGSGTEAPVLTPVQLATFRGWILTGAPGP